MSSEASPSGKAPESTEDVVMGDSDPDHTGSPAVTQVAQLPIAPSAANGHSPIAPDHTASPAVTQVAHIAQGAANAPSPIAPRVGTPARNTNGNDTASRATSQHPDPAPAIPKEAPPNGAPTRQYLNSKVTAVLMEGMKAIAKEKPKDPLRVLGEYLLQRSKELEVS